MYMLFKRYVPVRTCTFPAQQLVHIKTLKEHPMEPYVEPARHLVHDSCTERMKRTTNQSQAFIPCSMISCHQQGHKGQVGSTSSQSKKDNNNSLNSLTCGARVNELSIIIS